LAISTKTIEYDAQRNLIEKQTSVKRGNLDEKYTVGDQNVNQLGRLAGESMKVLGGLAGVIGAWMTAGGIATVALEGAGAPLIIAGAITTALSPAILKLGNVIVDAIGEAEKN
jgi:hypothetical protein